MLKRKKIYILLIIFVLLIGIVITGCQEKENENDKSETQSEPSSLEQVQQQSDEIVTSTMAKDWAGSLDKTKELMSTWNSLYPDIQKQGAKQDDVDAFVASINTLTDYLISKTLNLSKKPAEKEKKDEQSKEQEEESEKGSEEESKEESEKASEEESKEEKSSEEGEESQGAEEEKKDPKKILDELDPIISASEEDLIIINSSVEVTKYIPKFMSLFESPVPPDIFKLKYLVRHLYVASKLENWDIVSADLKSVIETWESIQPKALEADADLKTQLVQSINELEDVIDAKNANLTGVKCNFVIEQIESMAKTIKEKEEKKEESNK